MMTDDWVTFTETTPAGNKIKGQIYTKRNSKHGSIRMMVVNDHSVEYIVPGMPKLGYLEDGSDYGCDCFVIASKWDGSNILFYPLKDHEGNIIEIVPKTRNRAVADKKFIDLINKAEHFDRVVDYCKNSGDILVCELTGSLNKHEIEYSHEVKLQPLLRIEDGEIDPIQRIFYLHKTNKGWEFSGYPYSKDEVFDTVVEAYDWLANEYEERNTFKGFMDFEGTVWYGCEKAKVKKIFKCKPLSVREGHMFGGKLPKKFVRKAVHKFKDENDIYSSDYEDIYDFVVKELTEEYNPTIVKKSHSVIRKVIIEMSNPPVSYMDLEPIAESMVKSLPGAPVPNIMRTFVELYPQYKHEAGMFHKIILEKMKCLSE